jgi:hypothetical protein
MTPALIASTSPSRPRSASLSPPLQPLAADPLLDLAPVKPRKNRGHRGVQLKGNGLPLLHLAVERTGQRWVLDDRHPGPLCLFANLGRQQVPALRQHARRLHGFEIEAQRHRIVRRIRHHHRSPRDVRLHLPPPHLPPQAANARFHLRTAFHLPVFVAHILFRHAQPGFPGAPLHQVIDPGPRQKNPRALDQQVVHLGKQIRILRRAHRRNGGLRLDRVHGKEPQCRDWHQRLAQTHRGTQRKNILRVLDRIDALRFEAQRFEVQRPAPALRDPGSHRRGQGGKKENPHRFQRLQEDPANFHGRPGR